MTSLSHLREIMTQLAGAIQQVEVPDSAILLDHVQLNRTKPVPESTYKSKKRRLAEQKAKDQRFCRAVGDVLRERGYGKEADRLFCCGEVISQGVCDRGHKTPLKISNSNLPRLSPIAAKVQRRDRVKEVTTKAGAIRGKPVQGNKWIFATTTMRTNGDVEGALDRGWGAIKKLNRYIDRRSGKSGMVVEAECGPQNNNVHFHLILYGRFIPDLSGLWRKWTGDSFQTEIEEITPQHFDQKIRQVCKYLTKFNTEAATGVPLQQEAERIVDVWEAVQGQQLWRSYGLFRRDVLERWVGKPVEIEEDLPKRHCDECGRPFVTIERYGEGPRAPPADPNPERIRSIHERMGRRVDRETDRVNDILLTDWQSGKPLDIEWAKKRAGCLQTRGEKDRQLGRV